MLKNCDIQWEALAFRTQIKEDILEDYEIDQSEEDITDNCVRRNFWNWREDYIETTR